MTMVSDKSSAEIEREVERQRAEMTGTLDALRGRMTPGRMLDEAWEFARGSGGGDFVRNLGTSVRNNPLPVTLIGAGIAWLMSGRGGGMPHLTSHRMESNDGEDIYDYRRYQGSRKRFTAASQYAGDEDSPAYKTPYTEDDFRGAKPGSDDGVEGEGGETLADKVRHFGGRARDTAAAAGENVAGAASGAAGTVGNAAGYVSEQASAFGRTTTRQTRHLGARAWRTGQRAQNGALAFIEEQPLASALAGLALGALIGASLRSTSAEREWMGEASSRMKEEAKDIASKGLERTADTVERTFETMRDEAEAQGLTPGGAKDAADDIADRVRQVAEKGREKLSEEIGAGNSASRPIDNSGF